MEDTNPFKVGDTVVFDPDERAVGWAWSSLDKVRLKPGDSGNITRIDAGMYVYLEGDAGGFHWKTFKRAES
jgi:hypothetical protein